MKFTPFIVFSYQLVISQTRVVCIVYCVNNCLFPFLLLSLLLVCSFHLLVVVPSLSLLTTTSPFSFFLCCNIEERSFERLLLLHRSFPFQFFKDFLLILPLSLFLPPLPLLLLLGYFFSLFIKSLSSIHNVSN